MTDFAVALLFGEHRPQFLVLASRVISGVKLVEINRVEAQGAKRRLELPQNAGHGEVIGAVLEAAVMMAELGGDEPARAVVAAEVVADQSFGKVVAVAFRGVQQVNAGGGGLI